MTKVVQLPFTKQEITPEDLRRHHYLKLTDYYSNYATAKSRRVVSDFLSRAYSTLNSTISVLNKDLTLSQLIAFYPSLNFDKHYIKYIEYLSGCPQIPFIDIHSLIAKGCDKLDIIESAVHNAAISYKSLQTGHVDIVEIDLENHNIHISIVAPIMVTSYKNAVSSATAGI